jgi:hypothetical protein
MLWLPFGLYDAQAFSLSPNSGLASFPFVFPMNFVILHQYAFVFLHRPVLKIEKIAGSYKRMLNHARRFDRVEDGFRSISVPPHVLSDNQARVAWRS